MNAIQPPADDPNFDAACKVIAILQSHGHTALLAGGCVRDLLLNSKPKDYDVATSATPEQVIACCRRTRQVGAAFGVVLVHLMNRAVEVATFRTDGVYSDGRHPDTVQFCDPPTDARRRDFTVNALFWDPIRNAVLDYVHGQSDLQDRIIRAVGNPEHRFAEDWLRMLRAVRFAARLDFDIENRTAQAIARNATLLKGISRERIGLEIQAMLSHQHRSAAVRWLGQLKLDGPALNEPNRTARPDPLIDHLPTDTQYPVALTAWLLDRHRPSADPDTADPAQSLERIQWRRLIKHWRKALVLTNDQTDAMTWLLSTLPTALQWHTLAVHTRKRILAKPGRQDLMDLIEAFDRLDPTHDFDFQALQQNAEQLLADGVQPTPLLNGHDLIKRGLTPGPAFQTILQTVYDHQLDGEIQQTDQAMAMAMTLAEQIRSD